MANDRPSPDAVAAAPKPSAVRAPQDLVAGASLVVLALLALWAGRELPGGHLGYPGAGLLPRAFAALIGLLGLGLAAFSFLHRGPALSRWTWRGPFFVILAVVSFSLTVRVPGLVVAGPLVIMVSGAASPETRVRELAIFAVAMTAFCVVLFRTLLHLPIPILDIPGLITL